ncbi:MAG: hypothetical protein IT513_13460 [Burkholderiales bacterium]|nr:hypothetical protein [Burkholderiales bacterium]
MGASLVAAAENGIGAGGNVLQTQVSQIQATSNSGFFGIEINNTGNVDLAGITNNSGGFIFTNAGSVTVSAPISVTRRLFMQASGASDDIALNANLTFRSAGGGGIDQIIAGRDLTQSGGTTINSNGFPVTLTAGSTTATGVMTMNGAVAVADLNATTSGGAMQLPSGSVSGNLSATSNGGPITQAGAALTVTGTSNIDAGAALINLTQGGNDFVGDVTLTNTGANAVAITDGSGGLQFAASNVGSGTLTVVSNGGAITQSGPIIQEAGAGATSFSAGANLIDLTQANDFTGTVTLSNSGAANTVQITDANTITFAPLALGGDFTVNSGGLITLAGVGNTGLQQYNNAVSLTGAFSTGGGNFNATAATGITAGGATVTVGAGVATFTGAVEGPGALAVNSGAANGETFSSTIGAVTPLASISTDAPGSVSLGGNVTTVGAQTFLDAVNAGAITLTSTGGGTISAANAASDFTGAVNISTTGTASIADGAGGLTLGTVTAGTLNAASSGAGAAITGGPMTVGTATFNAGTGPVTLTNPANDFTGAVNLTGGATQIVDSNALTLGALSTGALTVTSTGALNLGGGSIGGALVANSNNGAIGQSGALGITGTSTIAAGAGSITLNNGGNDFGGGVAASGTGAAFFDVNTFTPTNVNSGTGQLVLQANNIAAGTIGGSGVGGSGGAAIVRLISPTPVNGLVVNFPNANNVNVVGGSGPWILTGSPSLSNPLRFTGFSPTSLQITMNGIPVGSIDGAAVSAASAAQANAAAAAAGDAADIFGTDSVAQQIEFGFAGDVGNLPPIDHRLQGVGIRVPSCFNESREGEECAK